MKQKENFHDMEEHQTLTSNQKNILINMADEKCKVETDDIATWTK